MDKFITWSEKHLVPIAGKIGSQRHLVSIRDAFIAMLPLTLAGSFAVLLNVFLRDIPTSLAEAYPSMEFIGSIPDKAAWMIGINGQVWWATIAMMALVFSFTLAYNLGKNSGVDGLPAGVVGLMIFIATTPQVWVDTPEVAGGVLSTPYLGSTGLFTAMFFILIFMEFYAWIIKKNIVIKMPDSVPPAVSKAFVAVIPGVIAVYGSAIVADVITRLVSMPVNDWIAVTIQNPLISLSQGYPAVLLITLLTQILWFFGLHGMNILAPVYETIWTTAQNVNIDAVANGLDPVYMWSRASFDIYGMIGGSGMTIGLVVSMFIFGKREDTRTIAKIGLAPGIFNINEPMVFGVPLVLNPIYLIPWIIVPVITITIGYFATVIGFAGPVIAGPPWVTPGILSALIATGGSIGAAITAAICLVVAIVIWAPFVILAEKDAEKRNQ